MDRLYSPLLEYLGARPLWFLAACFVLVLAVLLRFDPLQINPFESTKRAVAFLLLAIAGTALSLAVDGALHYPEFEHPEVVFFQVIYILTIAMVISLIAFFAHCFYRDGFKTILLHNLFPVSLRAFLALFLPALMTLCSAFPGTLGFVRAWLFPMFFGWYGLPRPSFVIVVALGVYGTLSYCLFEFFKGFGFRELKIRFVPYPVFTASFILTLLFANSVGLYEWADIPHTILFLSALIPINACRPSHWGSARNAFVRFMTEPPQRPEPKRTPTADTHNLPAVVPQVPVPAIPTAVVDKMRLKLQRSQRPARWGAINFMLDARIELPPEELQLVNKYNLGQALIYESTSRQKHAEAAAAHLESTRDQPSLFASPSAQLLGAGKMFYRFARAGISASRAALALRITVHSLIDGVHVECASMDELLDAENAIVEAGQNLKAYLANAATFDGQEQIIEL